MAAAPQKLPRPSQEASAPQSSNLAKESLMRNLIILTFVLALIVAPVAVTAQTGGDLFKAK